MNAHVSFAPVTPEMLERAGLRLDETAVPYHAYCAKPATTDDEFNEREMEKVEKPFMRARTAYRAILENLTGTSADEIERRVVL